MASRAPLSRLKASGFGRLDDISFPSFAFPWFHPVGLPTGLVLYRGDVPIWPNPSKPDVPIARPSFGSPQTSSPTHFVARSAKALCESKGKHPVEVVFRPLRRKKRRQLLPCLRSLPQPKRPFPHPRQFRHPPTAILLNKSFLMARCAIRANPGPPGLVDGPSPLGWVGWR